MARDTATVKGETPTMEREKPDKSVEQLLEELQESFRQIVEGDTYTDTEAMRERVQELREQS